MLKDQTTKEGKPRAAAAAAAIILEAMIDGVVVADIDGNIIQENKAYPKMYGYQTLVGKNMTELVAKEDLPRVLGEIKKMTAGIASKNLEFSSITHDGKRFSVLFNGTILKDEKGSVVGTLGVLRDITKLKKAQEEINTEKIRINATIQNLNEGVVAFDTDGNVILVNPMIMKLTGLPEKGFSLDEFIKLFKGVDVEAKIKNALINRQKTHIEEITLIGQFFYEMFFTPIIDPQDNTIGSAIIINDITHIKEVERMKTEFVSIASHQLRTPLTTMNWYIEMLNSGDAGALNDAQKKYFDEVYNGSTRMVKLVNDLLNVARLETGRLMIEPVPTQLEEFIKSINGEVTEWARQRNCAITFKTPQKKLPKIPIDQTLLRQVVSNLLSNAIRYSPKEKKCEVAVTIEHNPSQPPLTLRGGDDRVPPLKIRGGEGELWKEDNVVISVKDQGIGIPKEAQPKIFTKFFRADNARLAEGEGSGLGLSIAKMIMEASGGKIWFESEEGKGTTFYVAIPTTGMKGYAGEKGLA